MTEAHTIWTLQKSENHEEDKDTKAWAARKLTLIEKQFRIC